MSHHEKKGNKKMPVPRQEIIDTPHPYISVCVEIFLVNKECSVKLSGFQICMDGF